MRIAVPAEIKNNEYRVAITPAGVKDLVNAGHDVVIQAGAGLGSGIADEQYTKQGALAEIRLSDEWRVRADDALRTKLSDWLSADNVWFEY